MAIIFPIINSIFRFFYRLIFYTKVGFGVNPRAALADIGIAISTSPYPLYPTN